MPREKRLSSRLDTLLDAIFEPLSDPFSTYWEIAAELEPGTNAPAQRKIKRTLEAKNQIGTEAALLVACVLHLTGFPAHRILHFLSLYIPSTVSLSQFELSVTTIFVGEPPVPQSILYDLTQYTYLEKRLLIRKGQEVSSRLKDSLSPEVLLFLYLLSLRDDLSNENVQLISLVMKNCFPALEVRTRLGGASLEEYGELARALKAASRGPLSAEALRGARTPEPPPRIFDRDSASHFLDKYFSDEALAQTHTRIVKPPQKPARPVSARTAPRHELSMDAGSAEPLKKRDAAGPAQPAAETRGEAAAGPARRAPEAAAPLTTRHAPAAPAARAGSAPPRPAAREPLPSPARRAREPVFEGGAEEPEATAPRAHLARPRRHGKTASRVTFSMRPLFWVAPLCIAILAAVVVTILQPRAGMVPPVSASVQAPPQAAAPVPAPQLQAPMPLPAPQAPAAAPAPAAPAVTKYVVQQGDSVWKIYRSLGRESAGGKSWQDFLSTTRELNGLDDPDTILPGKVLNIAPQK
ncbi:MAG: LysM domain-containing protein [Spirochaetia bacterium]